MHSVLTHLDATDGPTGARCSRPIAGLNPALPAAAIDGHSLNALEFLTAKPSGGTISKTRPW